MVSLELNYLYRRGSAARFYCEALVQPLRQEGGNWIVRVIQVIEQPKQGAHLELGAEMTVLPNELTRH